MQLAERWSRERTRVQGKIVYYIRENWNGAHRLEPHYRAIGLCKQVELFYLSPLGVRPKRVLIWKYYQNDNGTPLWELYQSSPTRLVLLCARKQVESLFRLLESNLLWSKWRPRGQKERGNGFKIEVSPRNPYTFGVWQGRYECAAKTRNMLICATC
jgi:hypothetical protein